MRSLGSSAQEEINPEGQGSSEYPVSYTAPLSGSSPRSPIMHFTLPPPFL
jgi:hypothetical protein